MSFVYLDFVKENKYVQYTFNGRDYVYKIFSVSFEKRSDIPKFTREDFSKKEMKDYLLEFLEVYGI